MVLSDISIKRPVFATVLSLLVLLVGLMAYSRLPVREYPNIDQPVITVETTYRGASAEIVEGQVTQVLEESIAGIEGIEVLSSISRPEASQITIRFALSRDAESAANDVRDRVSRVRNRLPGEIDEPVIAKVEADAQPIIYLAFTSTRHSPLEITDYADRFVKDRLQNLPGVANVQILGERRYAMRLWLDRARLAAYNLTPADVEEALRQQNVEIPAGRIESTEREFSVLAETDLRTPAHFNDMILGNIGGYPVKLKDVGRAEIGAVDERRIVRFTGKSAVALGVVKQSTANPLEISQAVREMLPRITAAAPEGMDISIAYDSSVFIERSIEAVYTTIGEAVVLVALVIFLFLRNLRATIIPLVTIPVSLIGAFALMMMLGFTINTLTLLAMVLAIGLVVDDAIVMLENIHRHIEEGMQPIRAAIQGSREIAFAVMAMTVTLAAVYVPIGFMTGLTGRLFAEFALTLAGAVLVSGFVALSLSPMMCSRLLKHEKRHSWAYNLIERSLDGLRRGYAHVLRMTLRVRPLVVVVALAVAGSSYFLFTSLPSELAPIEDRSTIVAFGMGPEGATVEHVDKYAKGIEGIVSGVPEVDRYFIVSGFPTVSQMIGFIGLKPWEERERKQQDITRELMPRFFGVPGLLAFPINQPSFGQRATKPVQFVVQTSQSYEMLQGMVDRLMAELRKNPNLMALDTDLKLNQPQISVNVDREKLSDVGVAVSTVGRTLESMLGGRQVTRFKQEGKQYDVIVQVEKVDRRNPNDVTNIFVRGEDGQMIQLSNLISIAETVAPKELNRFNQLRAATISANLGPGYTLGQALTDMEEVAARLLPDTAQIDYSGESREFKESSAALYLTFALALGFIYLVLAAQFESFVDPFIIMLTVPLSMTGALLALYLTGHSLNVYSQIGLVTLVGLITKHGILIVEFANQIQRGEKLPKAEAVVQAAALRLRPILMTTGAMVLGSVPLALASGAGAESRQSIGWVIVGGILLGTFLTLFVVPAAYTLLARDHTREEPDHFAPQEAEVAAAAGPARVVEGAAE